VLGSRISYAWWQMTDINQLMPSFNDELAKHAYDVSSIGMKALQSALSGLKAPAGAAKRFVQRQAHGLTGWTPKGYMNREGIREMGAGAAGAFERLGAAERSVVPGPGRYRPGLVDRVLKRTPEEVQHRAMQAGHKELQGARKAYEAANAAEEKGLTSLPGYASALLQDPAGAIRTGMAEQWHSVGPAGKSMMVGVPIAAAAGDASREGDPEGPGRFSRAGSSFGTALGYTMGPLPFSGQLAASAGMGSLGKRVGGLFDKKAPVKHIPAPPVLEGMTGEATPAEHVISDRALGLGQGGSL
jgi:hypothetical protein